MPLINSEAARIRAAVSTKKINANRIAMDVFRIDGEYLSLHQLAERCGIGYDAVKKRMRTLAGASGAITVARIKAMGK